MKSLDKIIGIKLNNVMNKELKASLFSQIYDEISPPELFHVWFETISDLRKLYPLTNSISVVE
jgi:hypothetical protein